MRFNAKHLASFSSPKRTGGQPASDVRTTGNLLPEGFAFLPKFFDVSEQQLLLSTALNQLDATESIRVRRLQKDYRTRNSVLDSDPVESIFLPDHCYTFHEGHYDNVIREYREMRLSSWPEYEFPALTPVLDRLRALYPSKNVQTHLLHLASTGEILPHVDNVYASGNWILGVSLGASRILRMEPPNSAKSTSFDIILPSGSIYLQKDDVRYRWRHAILPLSGREKTKCGQRISIMIRKPKRRRKLNSVHVPHYISTYDAYNVPSGSVLKYIVLHIFWVPFVIRNLERGHWYEDLSTSGAATLENEGINSDFTFKGLELDDKLLSLEFPAPLVLSVREGLASGYMPVYKRY